MIIDTSAWIEFSRGSRGPMRTAVLRTLLSGEAATTDAVRLELLAGLSPQGRDTTEATLAACTYVPQQPWLDVTAAVDLYRLCRRGGETPRSVNDCLVAAIAIREGMPVLSKDRDFDVIARHSKLVSVRK
jgi:predicted nucleic acid-binding protein